MHRAVEFGLPEVVSRLLDYRPDLLIKDRDGQTVIDLAREDIVYFSPYESEENLRIINQRQNEAKNRVLAYVEVQKKKETILQKIDTAKIKLQILPIWD